jgi:hypothetical protein
VEAAHEYIDFLFSTEAKTVFEKYGLAGLGQDYFVRIVWQNHIYRHN